MLGVVVVIYALMERQWVLAWGAFFTAVLAVIALFLLPRMYGPFEIEGRRFRLRGVLAARSNSGAGEPKGHPGDEEAGHH